MADIFQYNFKEPVPKKPILMDQEGEQQEYFTAITIKSARTYGKFALIEMKQLIDQANFKLLDLMPNFSRSFKPGESKAAKEPTPQEQREQLKSQLSASGSLKDILKIFGEKILLNQTITKIDTQILTQDLKDRITYDDEVDLLLDFLFYIWPQP